MARTVLAAGTIYRSDRSESVYIITAGVASGILVPSQAELDASTTYEVTGAIAEVTGFEVLEQTSKQPIMGSTGFPIVLAGPLDVADSMLTFLADKLGVDITSILDPDDIVHVVFAPNADTAASYLECWKTTVGRLARPKQFGGETARVKVPLHPLAANTRALIP